MSSRDEIMAPGVAEYEAMLRDTTRMVTEANEIVRRERAGKTFGPLDDAISRLQGAQNSLRDLAPLLDEVVEALEDARETLREPCTPNDRANARLKLSALLSRLKREEASK